MPRKQSEKDLALLKEIRENYKRYAQAWASIREQGDEDMRALSVVGPWPLEELRARTQTDNPRPCPHEDIISQNNDRVKNQARLNKRGIDVTPKGKGANKEKATLREDRMRQIQYEQKAGRARLTAYDSAVDRSYGFYALDTDFYDDTFNQEIKYRRFPNPNAVLIDPDCKEADFSDMRGAFIVDRMLLADFEEEFPKAEKRSFSAEDIVMAAGWIDTKSVQIAEYWCVKKEKSMKYKIGDQEVTEEELGAQFPDYEFKGDTVILHAGGEPIPYMEREVAKPKVMKYITNGIEILRRSPWMGTTIPVVTVIGKEKWEDGKRVLESKTRKQRAPQLLYDLATAGEYESLAQMPKTKFLGYEGQFETATDWKMIHRNPVAYAEVKATIEGVGSDKPLPLPTFLNYAPDIAAYELAKESSMRAAMNAAGMPSAEIKDRSSKSGIAQQKMDEAADIASYHFVDNLDIAIEYEGRILNELLDKVEDSQREVGIRKADETFDTVQLNPTMDVQGNVVDHPYDDGNKFSVNISAGRDYLSQQERAKELVSMLLENYPAVAPLAIELENVGAIGDKMIKVLKALQPPEVRAAYEEDGPPPIPPEVQQQLGQYEAALEDAMKKLDEYESGIKAKQIEVQGKVDIETQRVELQKFVEQLRAEIEKEKLRVSVLIQDRKDTTTLVKTDADNDTKKEIAHIQDNRAENQQIQADQMAEHESGERDKDRQHERDTKKSDV